MLGLGMAFALTERKVKLSRRAGHRDIEKIQKKNEPQIHPTRRGHIQTGAAKVMKNTNGKQGKFSLAQAL